MVGGTEQLTQFLASTEYEQSLEWQVNRGRKIITLDPQVALALEMKAVTASGCSVDELVESIEAEPHAFNWFVAKKLSAFSGDDEEEYPPGEEPPPEERAKTIHRVGYSKFFLISHLCEFTLLRQRPEELEPYAKRYRIPQAKKYAKTLVRLFGEAREKASKKGSS